MIPPPPALPEFCNVVIKTKIILNLSLVQIDANNTKNEENYKENRLQK